MNNAIKIFTDYRQFQIFILGIFSGMPLAIIYTTLVTWMTSIGIDIAIVTTFAIARVFLFFEISLGAICRSSEYTNYT